MTHYDAIIIGAGAGGGVAAGVLAESGKSVLLLERGRDLSFEDIGRDHLRNQRLSQYGHNAGPDIEGNPRTSTCPPGERIIHPHENGYQNNAACVGSGTRVYGAQAWRFMPQDFHMSTLYGVPENSSLADWPISYNDLAPYYEQAEWEIGVCGHHTAMTHLPDFRRPYPMPPLPVNRQGKALRQGAAALGWDTVPVPLSINSVPYNERPACIRCQHCVGFACPVDAKNGTHNTMIHRALASGRCKLATEAMAECLMVNKSGRVTGVQYFDQNNQRQQAHAEVVIICAGAVETARLLLNSAHPAEPAGIGNNHDQVGRHLQGHYYPGAIGLFSEPMWDGEGPGVSTATCKFNHYNDGIIGGGMLADEFIVLPIIFWKHMLPPDLPRWGRANKDFMRESYRCVSSIKGPVQEIPSPHARVTLNPHVRDRWGIAVAHFSGTTHPETVRTAHFMHQRARDWLAAAGAIRIWGDPPGLYLSGGQHQAGTCRMGNDAATSVVDSWCRVHGHENLYIADGSVHVTNGGFNPALTIMALAFRTAENIVRRW
jgi:choline dehydrogenase-like flavoprotein